MRSKSPAVASDAGTSDAYDIPKPMNERPASPSKNGSIKARKMELVRENSPLIKTNLLLSIFVFPSHLPIADDVSIAHYTR